MTKNEKGGLVFWHATAAAKSIKPVCSLQKAAVPERQPSSIPAFTG
jgi:hypothetical protein